MFKTQFERTRIFAPSGERIVYRHRAEIKKDGRRELIQDVAVDVYNLIQSHKEETEIENIIRRATEGDYTALQKANAIYTDITNCPGSIAEAQQYIINAKENFSKLPKDTKAKFEYNPEIYIAEMANNPKEWFNKMGYNEPKIAKEVGLKTEAEKNPMVGLEQAATGTTINNAGGETDE